MERVIIRPIYYRVVKMDNFLWYIKYRILFSIGKEPASFLS